MKFISTYRQSIHSIPAAFFPGVFSDCSWLEVKSLKEVLCWALGGGHLASGAQGLRLILTSP